MKLFNKLKAAVKRSPRKTIVAAITLGILVGLPIVAVAEFYPNRPTFDYNKYVMGANGQPLSCTDPAQAGGRCGSMDGPVFNSFINTPSYGDERAFLDARRSDQTAAGSFKNVLENVTDGSQEVVIRTYVHNNGNQDLNDAAHGYKSVAKDAKVRIALPTGTAQALRARSYITASNAAAVEDTVDMTAAQDFNVEYVPGSATLYNNGPFKNGVQMNDSIVTSGAPIGYDALNGTLPGCFDYAAVIQIRIKVHPKKTPAINFTKQVRKQGDKEWKEEVATKPGDTVEWLLTTTNTGEKDLTNIIARDVLPPHVEQVPGTVKWIDADQNAVQNDKPLFNGGLNVGNYAPKSGFYVMFATKVLGDFEPCQIRVRNQGYVKSTETTETGDNADVIITRENCKPPTPKPVYSCDALKVTALGNRKYSYQVSYTAKDGAKLKMLTYNFGDGSTPRVTDQTTTEYTYAKDGSFVTRVTLTFDVDGKQQVVDSDVCAQPIKITPNPVCVVPGKQNLPPNSPECVETPKVLPNTGAGDVAAIFAASTVAGIAAYHVFVSRRLSRQ